MYTLIKIDEVNNLGAVRIRIRSLLASMKKREKDKVTANENGDYTPNTVIFTKEMKENYTILCPQMIPIHFELIEAALKSCGYNFVLLRECTDHTVLHKAKSFGYYRGLTSVFQEITYTEQTQ